MQTTFANHLLWVAWKKDIRPVSLENWNKSGQSYQFHEKGIVIFHLSRALSTFFAWEIQITVTYVDGSSKNLEKCITLKSLAESCSTYKALKHFTSSSWSIYKNCLANLFFESFQTTCRHRGLNIINIQRNLGQCLYCSISHFLRSFFTISLTHMQPYMFSHLIAKLLYCLKRKRREWMFIITAGAPIFGETSRSWDTPLQLQNHCRNCMRFWGFCCEARSSSIHTLGVARHEDVIVKNLSLQKLGSSQTSGKVIFSANYYIIIWKEEMRKLCHFLNVCF